MRKGRGFALLVLAAVAAIGCATTSGRAAADEARWSDRNAQDLIDYSMMLDRAGLDRSAYDVVDLEMALERHDAVAVELSASALFERIARDLSAGSTPADDRRRWRMGAPAIDGAGIEAAMTEALTSGRVAEALDAFSPAHAEFQRLSAALSAATDEETADILRLNMERWRWMPRNLGQDYVLVNVPSFETIVVRGGKETARRRVIAGALKTPTPQFAAAITGVVVNPVWFVPSSIVAESVGALLRDKPLEAARLGYFAAEDGGIRQKPGPGNSLGRMKLAMPNPYSVFIHDTPEKKNFDKERRALSHGCVRVDDALGFAAAVLGGEWTQEALEEVADLGSTVTIDLEAPIPVYIAYFTAMSDASGAMRIYDDVYGLDAQMTAEAEKEAPSATIARGECVAAPAS